MRFYLEPDSHGRSKIKFELDFPNYATKSDAKKSRMCCLNYEFAGKTDLNITKSDVDKGDIDMLKTVQGDCSKLSYVVHNVAVKKMVYHKLVP